jgi:ParB/RepB/Spo0J family partition protein
MFEQVSGVVHPVAALFPMLADDELDELAADIREHGLIHPIVVDAEGTLIDGRNRLRACQLANVKPRFTTLEPERDPVAYILSENVQRRHLSKGQQAMAVAKAKLFATNNRQIDLAAEVGVSQSRISYAVVVLQYAPDLADAVLAGAESLDKAYAAAQSLKQSRAEQQAAATRAQADLQRLHHEAPDLADLVAEERMTLSEALAALRQRQDEERQHRDVTRGLVWQVLQVLAPGGVSDGRAEQLDQITGGTLPDGAAISVAWLRDAAGVLNDWSNLMTGE